MDNALGEIRLYAGSWVPDGWLACDGSLQQISNYEALYALLGTTYGGNGTTTFGLPNLCGRVPVNQGQGAGLNSNYALAGTAGVENVTLTPATIPAHTHTMSVNTSTGNTNVPTNNFLAAPQNAASKIVFYLPAVLPPPPPAPVTVPLDPASLANAGGGQPHNNLMPYIVMNYIISTQGTYPQQG